MLALAPFNGGGVVRLQARGAGRIYTPIIESDRPSMRSRAPQHTLRGSAVTRRALVGLHVWTEK